MRSALALVLGLVAAAAAPVAGGVALAAGVVAFALGAWALARKPPRSVDFGLAIGGVVLGLVGAGLGAAILLTDDTSTGKLSYVDGASPRRRPIRTSPRRKTSSNRCRAVSRSTHCEPR